MGQSPDNTRNKTKTKNKKESGGGVEGLTSLVPARHLSSPNVERTRGRSVDRATGRKHSAPAERQPINNYVVTRLSFMDLSSLSHLCVKMSKEDEQRKRLSPKHTRTRTQHPALDQSVSNKARHAGASMRAGRDRTSLNRDACAGTRRSRGHSADPRTRRVPLKQPRHDHTPFGVSYGKKPSTLTHTRLPQAAFSGTTAPLWNAGASRKQ